MAAGEPGADLARRRSSRRRCGQSRGPWFHASTDGDAACGSRAARHSFSRRALRTRRMRRTVMPRSRPGSMRDSTRMKPPSEWTLPGARRTRSWRFREATTARPGRPIRRCETPSRCSSTRPSRRAFSSVTCVHTRSSCALPCPQGTPGERPSSSSRSTKPPLRLLFVSRPTTKHLNAASSSCPQERELPDPSTAAGSGAARERMNFRSSPVSRGTPGTEKAARASRSGSGPRRTPGWPRRIMRRLPTLSACCWRPRSNSGSRRCGVSNCTSPAVDRALTRSAGRAGGSSAPRIGRDRARPPATRPRGPAPARRSGPARRGGP